MKFRRARSHNSRLMQAGALLAAALLLASCSKAADQTFTQTPTGGSPSSPSEGSSSASASPSPAAPSGGFYLRVWQTQALAPQSTFAWLPSVTVAGGQLIDGRVAVPAIYPGPLWIDPAVRSISAAGIDSIVAEVRTAGLLGTKRDFTDGALAGAVTGHIQIVVSGITYDLTGPVSTPDSTAAPAAPGTAAAFEALWQKLGDPTGWLAAALGPTAPYEPARLAVLAIPPTAASAGINPSETTWPLATSFASFGSAFGSTGSRCAVVAGADLAKLIPVVRQSNQLTRFVDDQGVKDSLLVRVLVPDEPGPCN
jgi:hypothetical protein